MNKNEDTQLEDASLEVFTLFEERTSRPV